MWRTWEEFSRLSVAISSEFRLSFFSTATVDIPIVMPRIIFTIILYLVHSPWFQDPVCLCGVLKQIPECFLQLTSASYYYGNLIQWLVWKIWPDESNQDNLYCRKFILFNSIFLLLTRNMCHTIFRLETCVCSVSLNIRGSCTNIIVKFYVESTILLCCSTH